ncbi:MAG: type II toxin-antitoxin system RelE/ParE family toxin [Acidobacteria bacterium]|nr:type II toxin-antitoxin system RelE/ParE family toxin [Acidobacteriota bacterium]
MGRQLDRVQRGLDPNDWKPTPSVGPGVREIRVRDDTKIYRSIYVTNLDDAVYVLHVFTKRTRRTPTRDIRLARSRLRALRSR